MSDMKKRVVLTGITVVICAGMMVLFAGCKDDSGTASQNTEVKAQACGPDCTKPCCAGEKEVQACGPDCTKPCCADKEAVEEVIESSTTTVEQTTCPVMGGPINKAIFTEYEGKKVYFCCAGCDEKFKADPEKYLSKLPQFAK